MAAGEAQLTEAQLTDLLSGVVTGPDADQDGLTQSARTRSARTRPADRTTTVLPLPGAEGLSEQTEELTEQGDEQWSR